MPQETPAQQSPIMLADEIATCLGIGRTTAYRWLNAGKIPKVQISPKVFGAYRADVIAFIDSRNTPKSRQ